MKKVIALILVIICFLQSGGIVLIYQFRISALKSAAEFILKEDNAKLEKLVIPLETYLKSKVDQDEIVYDGKMYDIETCSIIGKSVEILAYHDQPEENFVKEFLKLFNDSKRKNKDLPGPVQELIANDYLIAATLLNPHFSTNHRLIYPEVSESIITSPANIFSPPPNRA